MHKIRPSRKKKSRKYLSKDWPLGTSLAVQWLGLHASPAKGVDLISGQGIRSHIAVQHGQKKMWLWLSVVTPKKAYYYFSKQYFRYLSIKKGLQIVSLNSG